jgi:hypothetical protein
MEIVSFSEKLVYTSPHCFIAQKTSIEKYKNSSFGNRVGECGLNSCGSQIRISGRLL